MDFLYKTIGQRLLFGLDAETAHGVSIKALQTGLHPSFDGARDPRLSVNVAGIAFPNPLGMAAGYDKNADVPDALLSLGFGHAEIGTVTPLPQPGNPKPRVFRLRAQKGVINRLGFNSLGHDSARKRLEARRGRSGIVGVNIGANKTSEDFAADYVTGIERFADLADYFTINISSPNTPGLRALQGADPLSDLLLRVQQTRADAAAKHGRKAPLFLKIAPDLSEAEMDAIAKALEGSQMDALIVSNTTISRKNLGNSTIAQEAGGLSGAPLFERSTIVLAKMRQRIPASLPIIGVGGVHDGQTAWQKIEAGASLVQLYTGLIYEGPSLPSRILSDLSKRLDTSGEDSLEAIVGRATDSWAEKPLD